ncbi:hypothetical protein LCGC14_3134440, partial [marine sediment metagenome]
MTAEPRPITHRRVLLIALPIVLSNATVPILGVVDTGVIGQMGAAAPIGAVGIGAIILTAIYWIFGFLRMGNVGLTSQAETDLLAFEKLVDSWPLVRECHMLAGETDFLLKIVAEDWDSYNRFLTRELTAAPNVSHVKSMLAIRSSKYRYGVPIDVETAVGG